ncbi:MAG TPA: flagellar biosynthesis protein FlhF [Rhodanobacter sp.]|nr:flagellar biosynthesis protein FlhF [Rhodanobacter sp.]
MKIKRFVAADMRQAMRLVREEQGPEAVILSTRRLADGIELIAAIDYDESLINEAVRQGVAPVVDETRPPRMAEPAGTGGQPLSPSGAAPAPLSSRTASDNNGSTAVPPPTGRTRFAVSTALATQPSIEHAAQETAQLREELGSMRGMLEMQLSSLAWNDMERRQPLQARVLRDMTRMGIESDVARALVAELPSQLSAAQARYLPLGLLTRNLVVSGRALPAGPAVTALVGPTGVGKTTTIAKLAARAVQQLGADQVALVSTDHYRIGAAAQLEHYGRLLGARVYPAYDADSLRKVLELLRDRHTVLVDTAGIAASDPRLVQQMEIFADAGDLRVCLVLAANAQAQALEDAVRAYQPLRPSACILTKLDEAPNLGGALSVLIRQRLPLDYTTDGQRVPEDIALADARKLVCRAAQPTRGVEPDDSMMAERFGLAVAEA